MEFVRINDEILLDYLNTEQALSPEDFLTYLEDGLELGEFTIDDAIAIIKDFTSHAR
jgi:hypothetical protein